VDRLCTQGLRCGRFLFELRQQRERIVDSGSRAEAIEREKVRNSRVAGNTRAVRSHCRGPGEPFLLPSIQVTSGELRAPIRAKNHRSSQDGRIKKPRVKSHSPFPSMHLVMDATTCEARQIRNPARPSGDT
jgi:hypothetical protein